MSKALPLNQFNNVIRWAMTMKPDRLKGFMEGMTAQLKRLGFIPRPRQAVKGTPPAGSDQFDSGSILDWARTVRAQDAEAVRQIVQIQATLRSRF